ncbi:MAG: hypothetical protein B6U72_05945 [Candidatus Altiarchaeales archaeon ex4484_2]|nr:MAG: hypothetical protein B6U72_05945 [Candidatus Altiarchaeales archaeon ex4484_2]
MIIVQVYAVNALAGCVVLLRGLPATVTLAVVFWGRVTAQPAVGTTSAKEVLNGIMQIVWMLAQYTGAASA